MKSILILFATTLYVNFLCLFAFLLNIGIKYNKISIVIGLLALLSSCANFKYTDYGRPFDFLKVNNNHFKFKGKPEIIASSSSIDATIQLTEHQPKIDKDSSVYNRMDSEIITNYTDSANVEDISTDVIIIEDKTTSSNGGRVSTNKKRPNTILTRKLNPTKNAITQTSEPGPGLILLFCFILPPVAVFFIDGGLGKRFWINILLVILALAIGFWLGEMFWLVLFYPIVHALWALLFG
jgi:uncharacterized membrane protein YqaE (UPF0057 family)